MVVTDTLPAGVTLISAASSAGIGCGEQSGVVTCELGDLASGARASIILVVTIDSLTTEIITNSATVTSQVFDPDSSDNQIDRQTTVTETDLGSGE